MHKTSSSMFMGGFIAVSLIVGGASDAHAAGKYTKKEEPVVANQTELTRPTRPAPGTESQQPGLSARGFILGPRDQVQAVNEKQIKVMQKLEAMTPEGDPEKPELLFRLGQLYEEGARYWNFRARELDEKIFEARGQLTDI